jgi:excisionase family DNA binding protein
VETIQGDQFLTAEEAAAMLGVKVTTLYAYASRGRLRSYRQGRRRRRLYRRAEVEGLLDLRTASPRVALPRAEDWVPYT